MEATTWDAVNVRNELVSCVEDLNPSPQRIIGLDAKTGLLLFKMIPVWMQPAVVNLARPLYLPIARIIKERNKSK